MMNINIPGSKSITNRGLMLAALARGKSRLKNALESEDTVYMRRALSSLGVKIKVKNGEILVQGSGIFKKPRAPLYCGNAGTAVRFLTAVLAAQPFESVVTGSARMRERPIGDLVTALLALGANISYLGKNGFPPIKIQGPLRGGRAEISGKISSQFLSALLIGATLAENSVTLTVKGTLVSKPYVDLTIDLMKKFGARVSRQGYRKFIIHPSRLKPRALTIESDASSASYFWGISALTGEKISIKNIPKNSLQADVIPAKTLLSFPRMRESGSPTKSGMTLKLDCKDFPDSAMTLAVLAAFRKGKTTLTGLANLRVKESDRLHALATELRKIGCRVIELRDGLTIFGDPSLLHGARIKTYNDHRMAMCFGMAAFVLPGIKIENPACVKKTFPNFWNELAALKNKFLQKNIILTGMRGTGKTRLGKELGRVLGRRFIDVDEMIERMAKRPIRVVVEKFGWKTFRRFEKRAVRKLQHIKNAVIATGGGTIVFPGNATALKKNGKIILLDCPTEVLKKRLAKSIERPSLSGTQDFLNELESIQKKRMPLYRRYADATVDVSQHTSNKIADLKEKTSSLLAACARLGLLK